MADDSKERLARQGMLSGDDVNRSMAERFGMETVETLHAVQIPRDILEKIPYAFAKRHVLLPIEKRENEVVVAVADPLAMEPLEELRLIIDTDVKPVYTPRDVILSAINDWYNQEQGAASQLIADLQERKDDGKGDGDIEVYDLLDRRQEQAPIVKLLNMILTEAIQQGASDIHFEPSEDGLRVRYRIDGVLQSRHAPAPEYQAQLLTRIKVMAKLDIAEHRLPQDGRIKLKMGQREIDFRVSTVPVSGGERIVLRILDKGNVILGLDKIGMLKGVYEDFLKLIAMPEGIILVTGPTGSGKTTTLYSAICQINSDEINVMTIEDPVEYNLKGIAQIGVRPKINLTFAAGLRHILRQDPDVIMVGEIRDAETAEIAVQASLTGHLVMSTLHTNDAPSAITRLVDMGVEPYLLSSSVVGVLAQRLVRRICTKCKKTYTPTDQELKSIGITHKQLKNGKLHHGKGCDACFGSGYKGRHGLYELLNINNAIKKQIVKSPDAVEIRELAVKAGMSTLLDHGAQLIIDGVTTVSEVLSATRGVEE
ncbi:MAG: type II secretion system ATPase GspE [Chlamydiia bacterium]|nr:type II secretion system ATPase GspE [Chlamydiia bacterium]